MQSIQKAITEIRGDIAKMEADLAAKRRALDGLLAAYPQGSLKSGTSLRADGFDVDLVAALQAPVASGPSGENADGAILRVLALAGEPLGTGIIAKLLPDFAYHTIRTAVASGAKRGLWRQANNGKPALWTVNEKEAS